MFPSEGEVGDPRSTLLTFWLTTGLHRHKVMEVADEDVFVFDGHLGELGYKD